MPPSMATAAARRRPAGKRRASQAPESSSTARPKVTNTSTGTPVNIATRSSS